MGFMGWFLDCRGYDYLLVVICRLTSLVHLILTATTTKATEVIWLFLKDIANCMGCLNPLYCLTGVNLLMCMAYHLQTDAIEEWAIRGAIQILCGVVIPYPFDWVDRLLIVEFVIDIQSMKVPDLPYLSSCTGKFRTYSIRLISHYIRFPALSCTLPCRAI